MEVTSVLTVVSVAILALAMTGNLINIFTEQNMKAGPAFIGLVSNVVLLVTILTLGGVI